MTGIPRSRRLTGRMVLAIAVAAFGVIIAVNAVLAVMAVRTFSGFVVPNSYVASQTFDHDGDAQLALGWILTIAHGDGVLRLELTDAGGDAVRQASLAAPSAAPKPTPSTSVPPSSKRLAAMPPPSP